MEDPTWDEFEDELRTRFGESSFTNYDVSIKDLRQKGSVQDYQAEFEDLFCIVRLEESALIGSFIAGLRENLRIKLLIDPPQSLRVCFVKARILEKKNKQLAAYYKKWKPSSLEPPPITTGPTKKGPLAQEIPII